MKILVTLLAVALIAAAGGAMTGWNKAGALQQQVDALRAELKALQEKRDGDAQADKKKHEAEVAKLKADLQDLVRLRGEVSQLKLGGKEADKLRAENEQLKLRYQQASAAASARATATPAPETKPEAAPAVFPKDAWSNAGYASPENAMITAMWAMHAGDPKAYFDSLTPAEQERILKSWEGKSEAEIAAKHRADAARIDSLSIVGRQAVSATEMWLTVTAPGPDGTLRTMLVPMYSADGSTWKFDGFKRPASAPAKVATPAVGR
jgi:hypothetical protein